MNTAMVRANQKLVDDAYDRLSESSGRIVGGISRIADSPRAIEYLSTYDGINLDEAIAEAHKGLSLLYQLQYIRDKEATVDLTERGYGMDTPTAKMLASDESPVIRSLPITDKIQPVNRVQGALPESTAAY